MHNYFIMTPAEDTTFCWIDREPDELTKAGWRMVEGVKMDHRYPADPVFELDATAGRKIPDLIPNVMGYFLVSSRLKELLEQESAATIEWLKFTIKNAKGRIEPDAYYCANILDIHDCIDLATSDYDESAIEPGTLGHLGMLYILADQVPSSARLFRLGRMPNIVLVRDDLRALIDDAGMVGIEYVSTGEECFFS